MLRSGKQERLIGENRGRRREAKQRLEDRLEPRAALLPVWQVKIAHPNSVRFQFADECAHARSRLRPPVMPTGEKRDSLMPQLDELAGGSSIRRHLIRSHAGDRQTVAAADEGKRRLGLLGEPSQDLPRASADDPRIRLSVFHKLRHPVGVHTEIKQGLFGVERRVPRLLKQMSQFDQTFFSQVGDI